MNELNLPPFSVKTRGARPVSGAAATPAAASRNAKLEIFDFLRKRYVTLTPEEWVRQHFTHWLVEHKGYPQGLLANEIALHIGDKTLRCDSVVYDKTAHPLMIIEYKAPSVQITQRVFTQISAYNLLLHVDYLVVSNGVQHYCLRMDYERATYTFLPEVPDYKQI